MKMFMVFFLTIFPVFVSHGEVLGHYFLSKKDTGESILISRDYPKVSTEKTLTAVVFKTLTDQNKSSANSEITATSSKKNESSQLNHTVNCSLAYSGRGLEDEDLKDLFNYNTKMMEITFVFANRSEFKQFLDYMFMPEYWTLTTGKHGRGLLMLAHTYPVLSLYTLLIGVTRINIDIIQYPPGCIFRQNAPDVEYLIRSFILSGIHRPGNLKSRKEEHVCNMNIIQNGEYAFFNYICCQNTSDDRILCKELVRDEWLAGLLMCIFILKNLTILFSPLLLPKAWYRRDLEMPDYKFIATNEEPVSITVLKQANIKYEIENNKCVHQSKFQNMPKFSSTLKQLRIDTAYSLSVSHASLKVKSHRLMSERFIPISIRRAIYYSLFRCKIRENEALKACCSSDICGRNNTKFTPWFKCLRQMMQCVFLIMVSVPWIIRLAIFFYYEENVISAKQVAAVTRGLKIPFDGNAILYLTPIHILFVLVYITIALDAIFVGVLGEKVKDICQKILRKCLSDLSHMSHDRVIEWSTKTLLQPFQWFGIAGFLLGWPFWIVCLPICFTVMVIRFVPLINLTFQLFVEFFAQIIPSSCICNKKENNNTWLFKAIRLLNLELLKHKNQCCEKRSEDQQLSQRTVRPVQYYTCLYSSCRRLLQLAIIIFTIISLFSFVLLLYEVVSFLIEIIVYTLIGVVLNAGKTMRFVSLTFLLILYAHDCFKSVDKLYISFNKIIHEILCERAGTQLKDIAKSPEADQVNTVLPIKPTTTNAGGCSVNKTDNARNYDNADKILGITVKDGHPKWRSRGFLLFLDSKDVSYISRRFFLEMCKKSHYGCPGPLYTNFLKAFLHFLIIFLFLMLVVAIVMAFGDIYQVSSTNQMLATLAGGFLPWMFRNVLFKEQVTLSLDKSNWKFQCELDAQINMEQTWPIADIEIKDMKESPHTEIDLIILQEADVGTFV